MTTKTKAGGQMTKKAGDLSDHDLITIDSGNYMVDWTVGTPPRNILVSLIPEAGARRIPPKEFRRNQDIRYRGRA